MLPNENEQQQQLINELQFTVCGDTIYLLQLDSIAATQYLSMEKMDGELWLLRRAARCIARRIIGSALHSHCFHFGDIKISAALLAVQHMTSFKLPNETVYACSVGPGLHENSICSIDTKPDDRIQLQHESRFIYSLHPSQDRRIFPNAHDARLIATLNEIYFEMITNDV